MSGVYVIIALSGGSREGHITAEYRTDIVAYRVRRAFQIPQAIAKKSEYITPEV